MASSLSNLVDNITEGTHKIKCTDCDCFLEYESFNDNSIKCKYPSCNKDYSSKFHEELKKVFKNTFKLFIVRSISMNVKSLMKLH